ncbi:9744_t:CDS:2 [Diversispora eburnea]|uniref:Endopeptidase S2P n=1 Tax=Diversispora eburnea TaxID=1213867 RepID=A0A9N9FEF3_9GLOM|nr:9744_t:CDS:2 [Diversispora eburnea]
MLLTFLGFWVVVHAFCHFIQQKFHSKKTFTNSFFRTTTNRSFLPTSGRQTTLPEIHISNQPFNVRFTTNILNPYFKSLANRAPNFWKLWFSIGAFVGILTMIIGIGVMIMASWKLVTGFLAIIWKVESNSFPATTPINLNNFVKRNFIDENPKEKDDYDNHQIPGVTLPMSHFAYYLIALLICGVIHEMGHAIAAAKERIEIKYTGIFLYIIYPGAFVEISTHEMKELPCFKQLRILCAGVWHNLIIFLLGYFILNTGLFTSFLSLTLWRSVDNMGVSVISVEKNTPLFDHIKPSMVITKLDDFVLNNSLDNWNNYLLENNKLNISHHIGFCASENDISSSTDCCEITDDHPYGKAEDSSVSCFKRITTQPYEFQNNSNNNSQQKILVCLPTIPILVNVNEQRCIKDDDCNVKSPLCVLPYSPPRFPKSLRIYYKDVPWSENEQENVLLFLGKLQDVWEIVQVSILQPRWSWVPLWIPESLELILRYTISFSLALCVLNILPAFQLDGQHALTALLLWIFGTDQDLRETAITNSKKNKRRKQIENGIRYFVTGLVVWVVVGTLISGIFIDNV